MLLVGGTGDRILKIAAETADIIGAEKSTTDSGAAAQHV